MRSKILITLMVAIGAFAVGFALAHFLGDEPYFVSVYNETTAEPEPTGQTREDEPYSETTQNIADYFDDTTYPEAPPYQVADITEMRDLQEGRRYINADMVEVNLYPAIDWGGGEAQQPTVISIPGETFGLDFVARGGMYLKDIWFVGDNRLYVNLDGSVLSTQGSAHGFAIIVSLYRTLFSIPGVEEIVVLVEGESEQVSDHIGFSYVERRDTLHWWDWIEENLGNL